MLAQAEKEAQGSIDFMCFEPSISCFRTRKENRRKARSIVAAADQFETRNRNCSRKLRKIFAQIILQNKIYFSIISLYYSNKYLYKNEAVWLTLQIVIFLMYK